MSPKHEGRPVKTERLVQLGAITAAPSPHPLPWGEGRVRGPAHALSGVPVPDAAAVESAMVAAREWLLARQSPEGWWCAELEADTTLESYFILFKWLFGHPDDPKIPKYARVLREAMLPEGGWNIYQGGPPELSISVLSYFALKLAGIPADAPDMRRSRDCILELGGATKANSYTKYYLAFFGQYDWEHVPAIPPEMILVPMASPLHIYDMSSWSRAIFVPLSIIYAHKPTVPIPAERGVDELFTGGREQANLALQRDQETVTWRNFFLFADRALKFAEKFPVAAARTMALQRAEKWIVERLPKSGGLAAILPAMMNSVIALKCLGYAEDHPLVQERHPRTGHAGDRAGRRAHRGPALRLRRCGTLASASTRWGRRACRRTIPP